jgi:hypothetical protein
MFSVTSQKVVSTVGKLLVAFQKNAIGRKPKMPNGQYPQLQFVTRAADLLHQTLPKTKGSSPQN